MPDKNNPPPIPRDMQLLQEMVEKIAYFEEEVSKLPIAKGRKIKVDWTLRWVGDKVES
jgi:hypothetical protein